MMGKTTTKEVQINYKTLAERTRGCLGELLANKGEEESILRHHLGVCYEIHARAMAENEKLRARVENLRAAIIEARGDVTALEARIESLEAAIEALKGDS